LIQHILDTGWDVVPADINEGNIGLVSNKLECMNLNRELPFVVIIKGLSLFLGKAFYKNNGAAPDNT